MTHRTQDSLIASGFEYGVTKFCNLKRALAWVDPNNSESIDNWDVDRSFGGSDKGYYGKGCVCGKDILYEWRIKHKETQDTMEIGSVCIGKFFDADAVKFVANAKTLMEKPNAKFCPMCHRKVRDSVVEQYPDEDEVYCKSCYKKKLFEKKRKLHNALGTKIWFGKHKNHTLGYILATDKSYLIWLSKNSYNTRIKNHCEIILQC